MDDERSLSVLLEIERRLKRIDQTLSWLLGVVVFIGGGLLSYVFYR